MVCGGWADVVDGRAAAAASDWTSGSVLRGVTVGDCCRGVLAVGVCAGAVVRDDWCVAGGVVVRRVGSVRPVGSVDSAAGWSAEPMVRSSGAEAACAWSPEFRSIEATVRPPPMSATAVATTARRWFFFHRASWRRRAARPCGAGGTPSMSSMAPDGPVFASTASLRGWPSYGVYGAVDSATSIAAGAAAQAVPARMVLGGAMSGA
ncbi:hypothetical protein C4B68_18375 [Streptomyces dengpaensis]|uniref:Uncharacterized protein n=1 Tax=Streptomyces dengpaensis TaxID=2049881 RepID=A0ABM6SRS3_9ACTN|nr:hypothetical protein C4B68_18375 [Streptomyces dengpaensis]